MASIEYELAKKMASWFGVKQNYDLLVQQARRLAEASGLEIRDDEICKATTNECSDLRDWLESVLALLMSVSKVALYEDVVIQRINAFSKIAPSQSRDDCWAMCGLILEHYGRYVDSLPNDNPPEPVQEEEEMYGRLPAISHPRLFTITDHVFNSSPSWYYPPEKVKKQTEEELEKNPNYVEPDPKDILNNCISHLDLSEMPHYKAYVDQIKIYHNPDPPYDCLRDEEFIKVLKYFIKELDVDNTFHLFNDFLYLSTESEDNFLMALYFIKDKGLPMDRTHVWLETLQLKKSFQKEGAPSKPNTKNFTVEKLSSLLRKSPIYFGLNAVTENFITNPSSSSYGGHAIIVYDIFYDPATQSYWVRLLDTGLNGLKERYDEYAYSILGQNTPNPNHSQLAAGFGAASFPVSFLKAPFDALFQSLEEAAVASVDAFPNFFTTGNIRSGWLSKEDNNYKYD